MGITKSEILMKRDEQFPDQYTQEISDNIDKLLICLAKFREAYGKPMKVTSGWRPEAINAKVGGSKKSAHMVGMACDFADSDKELAKFAKKMNEEGKLKEWGLWLENPDHTSGWVHLDIKDRKISGTRIFNP